MLELDSHPTGRHFLQIPGPTNVPDRVLRAIDHPTIDHRGPEFATLGKTVLAGVKRVFQTERDVVIYPASGTGAWEAALVNTLSARRSRADVRDRPFCRAMEKAGRANVVESWISCRRLAPGCQIPAEIEKASARRRCARDQGGLRRAQRNVDRRDDADRTRFARRSTAPGIPRCCWSTRSRRSPRIDYRHDEWGVDVTVGGSQKGLMLPPGLSFNAISAKALAASKHAKLPRSYWAWSEMIAIERDRLLSRTRPRPICCTACAKRSRCCSTEGLRTVFARHDRLAEATRRAVRAWGLEILCVNPSANTARSLTALIVPDGHSADAFRKIVLERFNMSLGTGLGKVAGKMFRIGHLGYFNDLMLCGTLAGVEMGLKLAGVPHRSRRRRSRDGVSRANTDCATVGASCLDSGFHKTHRETEMNFETNSISASPSATGRVDNRGVRVAPECSHRANRDQVRPRRRAGVAVRGVGRRIRASAPTPSSATRPRSSCSARASSAATRSCCRS